jgi:hypothetical protein
MKNTKNTRRGRATPPALRFSPYAWAKLVWLRDYGPTEIGGFAVCRGDDLLLVDEIELVEQTCTAVTVAFDDVSVADFFDRQVDAGLRPEQFSRIWVHTHPGNSATPSATDEETFARVFGHCQWALMFILAAGGESYARLQWNVGPRGCLELPVNIDYGRPFWGSSEEAWQAEYDAQVALPSPTHCLPQSDDVSSAPDASPAWWQREWEEYLQQEREFRLYEY